MRSALKAGLAAALLAVAWRLLRGGGGPEPVFEAAPAPAPPGPAPGGVEGYCVKERKKVLIKDPEPTVAKNGREAVRGTCPDCGATIFRFGRG